MNDKEKYYRLLSMTENYYGDWNCLNKEDIEAIKYAIAVINGTHKECERDDLLDFDIPDGDGYESSN